MNDHREAEPVAVVGMRGRVPGADDLDQFWQNLAEGVESITLLTPDEMRPPGFRIPSLSCPDTSTQRRFSATSTGSTPVSSASRRVTRR